MCLKYNHGRIGFHPITPVTSALPMNIIGMDFICGLPESNEGYTIVLIVIDIASCFVILCKLISKEAESVAEALLSVFVNFGVLKEIQSDQDPLFFNKVMEAFCNALTAKSRKVMRYYPAQNGAVERYVREVSGLVVKLLEGDMTNWVKFLPVVQMSLNDRYISRHKSTPFVVMFARERNQAANYEGLELEVATPEKLLERNRKMVYSVYPALAKLSKEAGKKGCDDVNEMRRKKRSLQPKPLAIGTSVMKEVDKRTTKWQQCWESHFRIAKYNNETKGYSLECIDGKVLEAEVFQKKKKKNRGFKIQLSEFSIFCCSVYSCGWLPQKILWKPLHPV